jgi:hypothetical protein
MLGAHKKAHVMRGLVFPVRSRSIAHHGDSRSGVAEML